MNMRLIGKQASNNLALSSAEHILIRSVTFFRNCTGAPSVADLTPDMVEVAGYNSRTVAVTESVDLACPNLSSAGDQAKLTLLFALRCSDKLFSQNYESLRAREFTSPQPRSKL